ncbi:MAG: TIGR00289 family protein [Euryarchaeota archaeon]|nr:TIGR00289 family protein [Euryarchaeota archaeon]
MRLGVLFSGGKDSTYALYRAMEKEEVVCLISVVSKNKASYMFHTPNIGLTALQAEAAGLPLVRVETEGEKEEELDDLERAIREAKERHGIEGVVTGAIASVYQAERVQRICAELDLWCFNPLWQKDQEELLHELLDEGFKVIISGISAYPLDASWLGRELDRETVQALLALARGRYGISPSGEGGEIETTVLDAPFFRKRIRVLASEIEAEGSTGAFIITGAELVEK